jgi:hypothetical protein
LNDEPKPTSQTIFVKKSNGVKQFIYIIDGYFYTGFILCLAQVF